MEVDASGWSGEGDFTHRLIEALHQFPIKFLKVEDAPASRADAGFSFISNELFVKFDTARRVERSRTLGLIPTSRIVEDKLMSLGSLESALASVDEIGQADYSDDGMLQYLRTERIVRPYQTRAYKFVELVRVYEIRD